MEAFNILTEPTPSLRQRSRELEVGEITTPKFQAYLDRLIHTMKHADGVGIASPQVGENVRAIVVNMPQGAECFINPEITKKSEAMTESEEGCLSIPGKYGMVSRHKKVSIRALNRHGRRLEFEAKQFPAIVFQHEIDHLDGILFIDKAKNITNTGNKHI
jgi:peptide deformylase